MDQREDVPVMAIPPDRQLRRIVVLCPAGHRMEIPYPIDGRELAACECGFRLAIQVEFI